MPGWSKPETMKIDIYPFYGSPDGENCLEKTYYYTKYAAIAGAVFSVYEMIINSKPSNVQACIARFGHFVGPAAAVGFTFGSAVCIIGQLRKKDSWGTHLVSGALAGCIYGAKYRSYTTGHMASLMLGVGAAYLKFFKIHNLATFEHRTRDMNYISIPSDFTIKLYDDPGRPDRA